MKSLGGVLWESAYHNYVIPWYFYFFFAFKKLDFATNEWFGTSSLKILHWMTFKSPKSMLSSIVRVCRHLRALAAGSGGNCIESLTLSVLTWLSFFGSAPHRELSFQVGRWASQHAGKFIWTSPKGREQWSQAQKQPAVMDSAWLISSKECQGNKVLWGNRKQAQAWHSHQQGDLLRTFPGLSFHLWYRDV